MDSIENSAVMDGLFLHADNGNAWDAEQVDVTITDDLFGGSYILTSRYFTEATEGHGSRFQDMVGTFKPVTSADSETKSQRLPLSQSSTGLIPRTVIITSLLN